MHTLDKYWSSYLTPGKKDIKHIILHALNAWLVEASDMSSVSCTCCLFSFFFSLNCASHSCYVHIWQLSCNEPTCGREVLTMLQIFPLVAAGNLREKHSRQKQKCLHKHPDLRCYVASHDGDGWGRCYCFIMAQLQSVLTHITSNPVGGYEWGNRWVLQPKLEEKNDASLSHTVYMSRVTRLSELTSCLQRINCLVALNQEAKWLNWE